MDHAQHLHEAAIVIDSVCPLCTDGQHLDLYRDGGVTVVTPTVAVGKATAFTTLKMLGFWQRLLRSRPDLLQIRTAADIREAKQTRRLGILLAFQGADAIEGDVDLIDAYKTLGVGVMQLTYNEKNLLGDGCEVEVDDGLTQFGREAIERMNEAQVVVDCSHTGHRTTMEAIAASAAPVILSHADAYGVHPTTRNVRDDQIEAIAATGGVIGIAGFPPFVSAHTHPTLDDLIDHVSYVADLVGVDHVGLGIDYFPGQDRIMALDQAQTTYEFLLQSGLWSTAAYPPPPWTYPEGIETPDGLPNLTTGLLRRGFSDQDVKLILGENWLRVFEAVWG